LPEELGIMATAINFAAITAALLTLGMEQTTQRLTAYYLGKDKNEYLKSVLWFFLLATFFLNILTVTILLIFSSEISQLTKLPRNVFFFSVAALMPLSISIFLAGVIRGYQNMRYLLATSILGDFIKLFVSVTLVLFLGFKVFGFLIGYLVAVSSVLIFRSPSIRLFISKLKAPKINFVVSQAIPSFVTQLFWLLLLNGQYLIISILQNTYDTGLFAVGMILSNQIYFIPRLISDALFPITSWLTGNRNLVNQQRNLINLALRYSLLIALPLLFFIVSFPKQLIFLIGRPHFFPAANLVPILILASLFFGIATLFSRTLYAIGKTITFQNISIASAIFYLFVSVTLTYLFSALGTSLAYLSASLFMTVTSLYYLRKYMGFKINFSPIVKLLASSTLTFSSLYIISLFTPNLIIGGAITAIFTLLYFFLLYLFNFYDGNDIKILDFVSAKIPFSRLYVNVLKALLLKKIQKNAE